MQLCLLHLDDALKNQQGFMETCRKDGAHQIEAEDKGAKIRLWGKERHLNRLQEKLFEHFSNNNEPQLCFMGSGDFHHVTALILASTLNKKEPVTLIHFDNHPDWVKYEGGIHCGSWVNDALKNATIAKVITIGVCSNDLRNPDWKGANLELLSQGLLELFPYNQTSSRVRNQYGQGASHKQENKHLHWQTIESIGETAFIDHLLTRIATKNIYITIDKDVLSREDAETNWDQGVMRLPYLLKILRKLGETYKIIGADVTGDYSKPNYKGSAWMKFSKRAEILMDQPFASPDKKNASALNEAANYAILEVLSEVMQ